MQAWRSLSYQATPAGPARPAGGKTLNKPHSRAGTVMENQPARLHQHDTEPLWAGTRAEWPHLAGLWVAVQVCPVILLGLDAAVVVSILWGALALSLLSWNLARSQGVKAGPVVAEHLVVAAVVIAASYLVGRWISTVFS